MRNEPPGQCWRLARSVLLLVPRDVVARYPDPGEPAPDDREQVVLKSGPSANKPWRRKPRLQVRLPDGFKIPEIRRALGMALAMEEGGVALTFEEGKKPKLGDRLKKAEDRDGPVARRGYGARVRASFERYPDARRRAICDGLSTQRPTDQKAIRKRFRMLATIHHPDSGFGHHERMTQLNEALSTLKAMARRTIAA